MSFATNVASVGVGLRSRRSVPIQSKQSHAVTESIGQIEIDSKAVGGIPIRRHAVDGTARRLQCTLIDMRLGLLEVALTLST